MDIENSYYSGEKIEGILRLNIKQGELIPEGAKVVVTLGDVRKEFLLSEIVVGVMPISGNYYAEGVDLQGNGEGYGLIGSRVIYPYVDFNLLVKENNGGSEESGEEAGEEQPQEKNEQLNEGENNQGSEEQGSAGNSESGSNEGSVESGEASKSNEESGNKESSENNGGSEGESNEGGGSESSQSGGGNFGITGSVISESEFVVSGRAKKGEDFVYKLEKGQDAEIVPGSVKVNGDAIGDDKIKLEKDGERVIVRTDYFVEEEGFGKEYLGNDEMQLEINLSDFNIPASNGKLVIEVIYEDELITSTTKQISLKQPEENVSEELAFNETLANESISNITLIKEIETIRISKGGNYSLNLSEHFVGAEEYEFFGNNVIGVVEGEILTILPDEGFKGATKGKIIAYANERNDVLESNEFKILVSSGAVKIDVARGEIKLNEKVKWVVNVSLEMPENVTIEIPKTAENVSVKKVDEEGNEKIIGEISDYGDIENYSKKEHLGITGMVSSEIEEENKKTDEEYENVVLNENATNYVVEYYTEEPKAIEEELPRGKRVVIYTLNELNYSDVLSYTNVSEIVDVGNEEKIKLYWVENKSYIDFDAYDLNENGKIDYVEWITPHLSNQTFEIILITKAEHLDENRTYIEDVYEFVKERDYNYSEIPVGHYLRVTFEKNLTNGSDITIYARSNYSNVSLAVYEENGGEEIANFGGITNDSEYKVFLTNLSGERNVFDLLVNGDENTSIEIDYVVDPTVGIFENESLDVSLAPINKTAFVFAWVDKNRNAISFKIYDVLGNVIVNTTDVDTNTLPDDSRVDVAMINSSAFVVGWIDGGEDDITFAIYDLNGNLIYGPTDLDSSVSTNSNSSLPGNATDVSVSALGDRFVVCYVDDEESDADAYTRLNSGAASAGEYNIDSSLSPDLPYQNLHSCVGLNSTRFVSFHFDDGTANDASFAIYSPTNTTAVVGQTDIDTAVGTNAQVAVTNLNNTKFAMAFYDSADQDITIAIRTINNAVVLAPLDIDLNVGSDSRVAIATINNKTAEDSFVVVWWSQANNSIFGAVYNGSGSQITAPFTIESSPSASYHLLDVAGKDPITGNSLCDGKFIVSYVTSSGSTVFKRYNIDGTEWNGFCRHSDNSPNVTLSYPDNDYSYASSIPINLSFIANVSDDYNLVNCSLWHNATGAWHRNQTSNVSGIENTTEFNLTNMFNVSFVWNVECYDDAGNSAFAEENRSVNIGFVVKEIKSVYYGQSQPYRNRTLTISAVLINPENPVANCSINNGEWAIYNMGLVSGNLYRTDLGGYDDLAYPNCSFVSCRIHSGNEASNISKTVICPWEMFERDAYFSGFTNRSTNVEWDVQGLDMLWQYNTGGQIRSSAAIGDISEDSGFEVVINNWNDYVFAFNASGSQIWNFTTGAAYGAGFSYSMPTLADINGDGKIEILIGSNDNKVYALNSTGGQIWNFTTGDDVRGPITAFDINGDGEIEILFGSYDDRVYCLNSTGGQLWNYTTNGNVRFGVAVADINDDGIMEIITGSHDYNLYVLNSSGSKLWNYSTGDYLYSSAPTIADIDKENAGLEIIFGSDSNRVYALNSTGSKIWDFLAGGDVDTSPAIADINDDGNLEIVFGANNGVLYCLNSSGGLLWNYSTGASSVYFSPVIADLSGDGNLDIIVGSRNNYTLVFNYTGQVIMSYLTNGWFDIGAAVADIDNDGRLEIISGSTSGVVYVLTIGIAPTTNLVYPANGTETFEENISFKCNASDDQGLNDITLYIWNETSLYYSETKNISGLFNESIWNVLMRPGNYEWNCFVRDGGQQYDWANENWSLTIFDSQPKIWFVSNISDVNPVEATNVSAIINFSVYDFEGFEHLNFSSIKGNVSFGDIKRDFDYCENTANYSNYYANFSCLANLWYFDKPGYWNISISIEDNRSKGAVNNSGSFKYNQLQAIVIYPQSISFGSLEVGAYNVSADYPITINNTGNANLSNKIAVVGINLVGEINSSYYIDVKNISINSVSGGSPPAECNGNRLENASEILIPNLFLEPGNLSAGFGKNNSYYCLTSLEGVIPQRYSTLSSGSWVIKIV